MDVIKITSQENYYKVIKICDGLGYKWASGNSLPSINYFKGINLYYCPKTGTYDTYCNNSNLISDVDFILLHSSDDIIINN